MICTNCKKEISNDSQFCPECGSKIDMGECLIKITRPKKIFGFAISFKGFVDGVEVGSISSGSTIECRVSKGTHKIEIKAVETTIEQEVTLNDTQKEVEITVVCGMGIVAGRPVIKAVNYR